MRRRLRTVMSAAPRVLWVAAAALLCPPPLSAALAAEPSTPPGRRLDHLVDRDGEHPYSAVIAALRSEPLPAQLAYYREVAADLSTDGKYPDRVAHFSSLAADLVHHREYRVIEPLAGAVDESRRRLLWRALGDGPPGAAEVLSRSFRAHSRAGADGRFADLLAAGKLPEAQAELLRVALDRACDAADRYRAAYVIARYGPPGVVAQLEPLTGERETFYLQGSPPWGQVLGAEVATLLARRTEHARGGGGATRPASRPVTRPN